MPINVVDCFEVIEIEHDQRTDFTVPYRIEQRPFGSIGEVMTVADAS